MRGYFYDVPVYRLEREVYYAERNAYVDAIVYQTGTAVEPFLRKQEATDPHAHVAIRSRIVRSYGGCWEFNEVVGYIRLHFLGTQIRGEYFETVPKRKVRTRSKTFEWKTWKLVPEVEIDAPYTSHEILCAVRHYIANCMQHLQRRHVDVTLFEKVAPHIDWQALHRSAAA